MGWVSARKWVRRCVLGPVVTAGASYSVHASSPPSQSMQITLPSEKSNWDVEFDLKYSSYLRANSGYYQTSDALNTLASANMGIGYNAAEKNPHNKVDIHLMQSIEEEKSYIDPREFYLTLPTPFGELTAGRKIFNWFKHDEAWSLGLWENRFSWDKIDLTQQGMLGLFLSNDAGPFHLVIFGSPFYLPEYVSTFDNVDGTLYTRNPWYRSPPKSVDVLGSPHRVDYTLEIPNIWQDIVQHPSGGVVLSVGNDGTWARMGYSYKPINQLLLGFPFYLKTPEQGSGAIAVDVHPRVLYHHLVSGELGAQGDRLGFNVGATREVPIRDQTPDLWITQETDEATNAALELNYRIEGEGKFKSDAYLGAYKRWGGDVPDKGPFPLNSSFFEGRYYLNEAVSAGFRNLFLATIARPIYGGVHFVYDFAQRGAIFTAQVAMRVNEELKIGLRGDAIGPLDETEPSVNDGLIRNYRANDRVQGTLSYVF